MEQAKYSDDGKTLIRCPKGFKGHFVIPYGVISIGDDAFAWCETLQAITIPNSVTNIGNNPFKGCEALESINCLSKHFVFCDDALYTADMIKIIAHIGRTNIFTIPNSINYIGNHAFSECLYLTSIKIPNSVTSIGNGAFGRCI